MNLLSRTLDTARRHLREILVLNFILYMPYFLLFRGSVAFGLLPKDAADGLFGLIGLLLAPLGNGAIVWLTRHWIAGVNITVFEAFRAAGRVFTRLLAAYISIGFIALGWLAVSLIPPGLFMLVTGIHTPLVLVPLAVVALIWVLSRFVFVDALIVTANKGPWEARHESARLVKTCRAVAIGSWVALVLPLMTIDLLTEQVTELLVGTGSVMAAAVATLIGLAGYVLYTIPMIMFYLLYDQITRTLPTGTKSEDSGASVPAQGAQVIDFRKPIVPRQ